jgi:hypothetical protein
MWGVEKGGGGMSNVLIAVFATVVGFTTSAIIEEVRSVDAAVVEVLAVDTTAQFRPILSLRAPVSTPSAAPVLNDRATETTELAAVRAFVLARPTGRER